MDDETFEDTYDYDVQDEDFPTKSIQRSIRRDRQRKALQKRGKIIKVIYKIRYHPMVGFYSDDNSHIIYPRDSVAQRYLKRRTSKCMRQLPLEELCGKSNIHHKYQEYWWELD